LQWPEGVTVFEGSKVTGVPVIKDGKELAHIYGISFPQRDVFENLALGFEKNQKEGFALGVLHANVGGNPDHDKYAPCALKDLASRGMDYWALGHIHLRQVLRESDPAIVYCGNPQAKNIKETGEKGCYLVTLNQGVAPDIQFKPTDALRFIADRVDLGKCTTLDQVIQAIQKRCEKIVSKTKDRDVVIRLTLEGRTAVHKELSKGGSLDDLQADAQYFFEGQEPFVWVELVLETQGEYDVDSLRQGQDFIADIISIYDDADQPQILEEIRAELQPLFESWPGRKYLENISDDELKGLLVKARNLSLDQMVDVD
jgi:DNA repair exonuclease SbcCD nuclease subunit